MQIFVRAAAASKTYVLEVQKEDRILDVKSQISDQSGIPESWQSLFLGNKALNNSKSIKEYGINNDEQLHLTISQSKEEYIKLHVSTLDDGDGELIVSINMFDNIGNIKKSISDKLGLLNEDFDLSINDTVVDGDDDAKLKLTTSIFKRSTLEFNKNTAKIGVKMVHHLQKVQFECHNVQFNTNNDNSNSNSSISIKKSIVLSNINNNDEYENDDDDSKVTKINYSDVIERVNEYFKDINLNEDNTYTLYYLNENENENSNELVLLSDHFEQFIEHLRLKCRKIDVSNNLFVSNAKCYIISDIIATPTIITAGFDNENDGNTLVLKYNGNLNANASVLQYDIECKMEIKSNNGDYFLKIKKPICLQVDYDEQMASLPNFIEKHFYLIQNLWNKTNKNKNNNNVNNSDKLKIRLSIRTKIVFKNKRFYSNWTDYTEWIQLPSKNNGNNNSDKNGKDRLNRDCVACMYNPIDTVMIPCGHASLCIECYQHCNNKCPLCRQTPKGIYRLYI